MQYISKQGCYEKRSPDGLHVPGIRFTDSTLLTSVLVPRVALDIAVGLGLVSRVGGILVPAINIIMGAWLLKDLTGAAYRVTIPGVVLIIYMRRKMQTEKQNI